jgi:deoxyribodipyrimidine photo-lyase
VQDRVRLLNGRPFQAKAKYVLYWAQMNRRVESNHALAYAIGLANQHELPVLFYEGLTCTYPYANDRLHTFLLEGVPDTARALKKLGIGYAFYPRRKRTDPNDIVYQLAAQAGALVTDDYPAFIARSHNGRVPERLEIPYFVVDSSCVVPMNKMEKLEYAAYTIRPKIKKLLPEYLHPVTLPAVTKRYLLEIPAFHTEVSAGVVADLVAACEIDHSVKPSLTHRGGSAEAQQRLDHFLNRNLRRYARERNEPSAHATSGLSPYLHFGHISSLDVALKTQAYAAEHDLIADEFLEELIVRRELAFNHAKFTEDPAALSTVPNWATETMRKHAHDERSPQFDRDQLERSATYDPLWNATQKELLLRGTMHGYYRMYWGKKIIEWSASYRDALDTMIYFHDRFSLDGRDPNTYTNILWCLGLHDRPWHERPIFGMLRYMSYDGMKRKTNVEAYIREIEYVERTGADPFRLQ